MEYKVKSKIIDGIKVYGIINERLETVLPFEYLSIEEAEFLCKDPRYNDNKMTKYYVITGEDGKKGAFMDGVITAPTKYDSIEAILQGETFIVGKKRAKKMEYGIISSYQYYTGPNTELKIREDYKMGKADEIIYTDGKVMLYKNSGDIKLSGVYADENMGTFDPEYTELKHYEIKCSYYPNLPDPKRRFVDKTTEWLLNVDQTVRIIVYSKLVNGKILQGIYVRAKEYEGYEHFGWKDLVPCEYDSANLNPEEHLINLNKTIDGKKKKGLMGYAELWDIDDQGALIKGMCTLKEKTTIPCEYDVLTVLCPEKGDKQGFTQYKVKFVVTNNNGKYGLIKMTYNANESPYDKDSMHIDKSEIMLDCIYDSVEQLEIGDRLGFNKKPSSFIFILNNKKGIVLDNQQDNDSFVKSECKYKNIEGLDGRYVFTDQADKKCIAIWQKKESQNSSCVNYDLIETPSIYEKIKKCLHTSNLTLAYKSSNENCFDIYNGCNQLIASDAYMLKVIEAGNQYLAAYTQIDEETNKISIINGYGEYQFEEQGKELEIIFDNILGTFIVKKDGIITIKKANNDNSSTKDEKYIDKYKCFEIIRSDKGYESVQLIKYLKHNKDWVDNFGLYKIGNNNHCLEDLLLPEYESIDVIINKNRSIVAKIVDNKTKYGVVENIKGNSCISLEYDEIILSKDENIGDIFIAINYTDGVVNKCITYDSDGFIIDEKTMGPQKTLSPKKK